MRSMRPRRVDRAELDRDERLSSIARDFENACADLPLAVMAFGLAYPPIWVALFLRGLADAAII